MQYDFKLKKDYLIYQVYGFDNFNNKCYRIFFWLHGPDYDSSTHPTIIIMTRNQGTDEKTKNARWEGSRRGYWDCFYQTRNSTKTAGLLSDLKIT